MEKMVKFVECLVPIASCNLKCKYCYVIQENRRNKLIDDLSVSPDYVGKAFAQKRWGGQMLINLCGYGETLAQKNIVEITYEILKQGHYVNLTNNGTMTKKLDEFLSFPKEFQRRLCFAFSLHYVELKKHNLLSVFASNVKKIKDSLCSFLVQINLCDDYIDLEEEIKEFCVSNFGAFPQVALTRKEEKDGNYSIFTKYSDAKYYECGKKYNSPLFETTFKNFNVRRKEFCYAGDWSYKLDLATGNLRSCYFSAPFFNIYDDLEVKIPKATVGRNCKNKYCINSSHFLSLGVIPSLTLKSYGDLRNREDVGWLKPSYLSFVNQKLFDNNKKYNLFKRIRSNISFFSLYYWKKIIGRIGKR